MSTPYNISTASMRYHVVDDVRLANRVLAFGSLQDEAMLRAPSSAVKVRLSRTDLRARVSEDGFYAISGRPEISFAAAGSLPALFDVTLSARGYRDLTFAVTLPGPPYPFSGPAVWLRPNPVTVHGRVTDAVTPATPQPGAAVASGSPLTIATRTVLHFDHANGVTIRRRTPSAAGAATALSIAVLPGDRVLELASIAGIAANSLLRIGPEEAGEFGIVNTLDSGGSSVTLTAPLTRGFAAGVTVQRMNRGASTAAQPLAAAAFAGEGVLRIAAALTGTVLQIDDAGREEFHSRGVVADANGYFVLAGVTGLRNLDLTATAAGFSANTIAVALDYARPVQQVDFRLTP